MGNMTKNRNTKPEKHRARRSLLTLVLFCLAVASGWGPGVSAATQGSDNAGLVAKGRELFGLACVQCHGASHTTIQRKPEAGWRKTVYTMISRGAPVLPGEVDVLVGYLTSVYGPASPPAALENPSASKATLPAGSELIVSTCGTCHPAGVVFGSRKSENAWRATVKQMRSLGASITDAQEKEILAYLVKHLSSN